MISKYYSLQQKIYEFLRGISHSKGIPIFMVHHVNDDAINSEKNLTIRNNAFQMFINELIDQNYLFISPNELEQSLGKKACMITFDDVYKDAMENGISYLEAKQIPYVCFVSPGLVNTDGYIDSYDLLKMKDSELCTIGAHGLHHQLFRNLTEEEKKEELSKTRHELLLGCEVEDFAFPYGSLFACDKNSIKLARNEYSRVYSTLSYLMTDKDRFHLLPRINLNSTYALNNNI